MSLSPDLRRRLFWRLKLLSERGHIEAIAEAVGDYNWDEEEEGNGVRTIPY